MREMIEVIEISEIREMTGNEQSHMIEETEIGVKSDNINPVFSNEMMNCPGCSVKLKMNIADEHEK
jgi:hypothetical protein